MPDELFENPRLVAIYDCLDGERSDLQHYLSLAWELKAKSVLDVGCGTGAFACLLSHHGFDVTGLDPAKAPLDFARRKPNAERVHWIFGETSCLPAGIADCAFMTGNVAQVFLTEEDWEATLLSLHRSLHQGGHLVFEARNPASAAWLEWTREKTYRKTNIPDIGLVEHWCDVTDVSKELVSFRWTYFFGSDGAVITSDSTLRFRCRDAIEESLRRTGFVVREVRDAPDRPGKEFVFVAARV
jgi:SAM-dependent methyltransferase